MCTEKHESCRQPTTPLPSRVIDVESHPRLVTTGQCAPEARYVALSHCWGDAFPMPMTTKKNIAHMERGVAFRSLPKTLKHAIRATSRLNIKYLWVDALCIIHDDEKDKQAEADKIGDYFRNAYLTISALSATDGDKGFLDVRPKKHIARLEKNWFVRPVGPCWEGIFRDSTLGQRGWALQE